MDDLSSRHQLFMAAQRRLDLSLNQLWLRYIALTGSCAMIDIDAFLHGLSSLPAGEQDILAHALNERLDEVYEACRVPYLAADLPAVTPEDPLTVLHQLLDHPPPPPEDPHLPQ
jgi:hypothetical protein